MTDTLDPTLPPPPGGGDRTEPVDIQQEMQRSYIDYAMSVIVGRALPLVEDGLKPVHRRVLYSMGENGFRPDRRYVQRARVVRGGMGNYHPPRPAVVVALPADRRAGQLRVPRQRPTSGHEVYGMSPLAAGDGDAPGHQRGDRRLLG